MKPSFLCRVADAVFLARPLLLIPVWGYCAFGYVAGLSDVHGFHLSAAWKTPFSTAAWMLVFSCSVGAVYAVNQIADRHVDAVNAGFPMLAKGNIPLPLAGVTAFLLAAAAVLIPLAAYPAVSLFSAAALAVGFLYCVKPFYFSGRAGLDFITNAAGYGFIAFGVGWLLSGAAPGPAFFISSSPYFLLMCAGSISSTLPDIDGDRAYGKNTTAVTIGLRKAHVLASMFIAAGLTVSLLLNDWVALTCSLCAVPLYGAYLVRKTAGLMEATYKIGGLIMMLIAAVVFPYLVAGALLSLVATIAYFRLRFHVWYPSLVPAAHK
ncbi:MAG TPA: UbiA family prenyltransferase [Chitinivibrionales bacterium]|nr:UbiA family prenyltransferase [Chitinivibrionales bacterium]